MLWPMLEDFNSTMVQLLVNKREQEVANNPNFNSTMVQLLEF